jgi:hypothetical protein
MIQLQAIKLARLVDPGVVKNNAAFTSQVVDGIGADYASLIAYLGTTDIGLTALKVQESDDNSTWTDVSGTDFSNSSNLDWSGNALALPSNSNGTSFYAIQLDLRVRKRYLKLVATGGNGTNGTYMTALALLGRLEECPKTAATAGAQQVAVV